MTVWPFRREVIAKDRSGETLASGKGSWWRNAATPSDVGQRYSYGGVVDGGFAAVLVGKQNRILVFGDDEFRVEDATLHETLGYVEVGLVKVAANG